MTNHISLMSKNSHVPARKAMDDTKGRFHIRFISLPQRDPSMAEYIGFTMKNNIMHNAIPEHSDASLATANGNTNITAIVTVIHKTYSLATSFFIIYPVHSCVLFHSAKKGLCILTIPYFPKNRLQNPCLLN